MSLKEQLKSDSITILNIDELAIVATYEKIDGSETVSDRTYSDFTGTYASNEPIISINCLLDSLSASNLLRGNKDMQDELIAHTNIDFTPTVYDKVTIDGEIYKVMGFDKNDLFTSLHLSKNKRPTGKNYGFRD